MTVVVFENAPESRFSSSLQHCRMRLDRSDRRSMELSMSIQLIFVIAFKWAGCTLDLSR